MLRLIFTGNWSRAWQGVDLNTSHVKVNPNRGKGNKKGLRFKYISC